LAGEFNVRAYDLIKGYYVRKKRSTRFIDYYFKLALIALPKCQSGHFSKEFSHASKLSNILGSGREE